MNPVCDFCRKPVYGSNQDYKIAPPDAYHIACLDMFVAYVNMKSTHNAWCHLTGCAKGPVDPFKEMADATVDA